MDQLVDIQGLQVKNKHRETVVSRQKRGNRAEEGRGREPVKDGLSTK